jgi:parallel beta-helix repeat protein
MNRATLLCTLSALAISGGLLVAGPFTPPAGPVASSYKTLSEVEPRIALSPANTPGDTANVYRITQPGSYYLVGNIAMNGKTGVSIESDSVTLDLRGFEVYDAVPGAGAVRNGIYVSNLAHGVCIRNGSIRNTNSEGLRAQGTSGRFEHLSFYACHGSGLYTDGPATISSCTAQACLADGFDLAASTVTGCTAAGNSGAGFYLASGCTADGCTAQGNTGRGFNILGSTASHCISDGNLYGFDLNGSQLIDSSADGNNSGAVRLSGSGNVVRGNQLTTPPGFANILVSGFENRIEGNTTRNGSYGVLVTAAGSQSLIVGNMIFSATAAGISANMAQDQVGPIVTAVGTITSTNPFANFVR